MTNSRLPAALLRQRLAKPVLAAACVTTSGPRATARPYHQRAHLSTTPAREAKNQVFSPYDDSSLY